MSRPRWLILIFCSVLLVGAIYSLAGVFLALPAQQPLPSDAMVILGGEGGARTLRGVELSRRNFSRNIVLTGLEGGELSAQPFSLNWRLQMLIAGGVPKESIEIDAASKNSWEEAAATLKRAQGRGWKRVMVVSDPPHKRHLKWSG